MSSAKTLRQDLPYHLFILAVLALTLFPIWVMVAISFKSSSQFFSQPFTFTWPLHWENYSRSWLTVKDGILNSVFISVGATLGAMLAAIPAAYVLGQLRPAGARFLWGLYLFLLMMPAVANLIPLFTLLGQLNLLNSLWGLIWVGTAAGQVFSVFVLKHFVEDLPKDLFEAAEIDGASHFARMVNIVIPLSLPILATIGVMRFIHEWNNFILPLVAIRDEEKLPLVVKLFQLDGAYVKDYGVLMAAYVLASVPLVLLFLAAMKSFVRGLSSGAVKG